MPRRIVIATAVALVPLIAGCEAGTNAPSLQWHAPTDGTGAVIGGITISNAFVLGAPIGSALRPGQNAGLFFGLTNTGTSSDRLVSVSACQPGNGCTLLARSVLLPGGQVVVNSQRSVLLTGPRPKVILEDLLRPVTGGSVVKLVLTFRKAGQLTLGVPVMPMAQYYATLSPPPAPTSFPTPAITPTTPGSSPSPSPSRTTRSGKHHGKHRTPSPSPTPSPSASP
jgi:hypothetical protein